MQPCMQVTLQSDVGSPQVVLQPPPQDMTVHVAFGAVQSEWHPPTQLVRV
jgi:hypothetical protein